jgi:hypothetical protein
VASFAVDWTLDVNVLMLDIEFRRAGNIVIAACGTSDDKDSAKRKLAEHGFRSR